MVRMKPVLKLHVLSAMLASSSVEAYKVKGGSGPYLQDIKQLQHEHMDQEGELAGPHELHVAPASGSDQSQLIHLVQGRLPYDSMTLMLSNLDHAIHNRTLRQVHSREWPEMFAKTITGGYQWGNFPNDLEQLDEGSTSQWLTLAAVVPVILVLDYVVMNLMGEGWQNHIMVLCLWVICAIAYNVLVFLTDGVDDAVAWSNGFILEGLLSLDNLFAYHLVIISFKVPPLLQRKAIFFGILGAMVLRVVLYCFMAHILYAVAWFRFILGAFIIYSGVQGALADVELEEPFDADSSWSVQAVHFLLGDRMWSHFDTEEGNIFVYKDGGWRASLLLVVIVCLEAIDVVFACDSVGAKLAVVPDQYICYSSSIFAMFALRGMFFLVQDLIETFYLLKYGLGLVLVAIGMQLLVSPWYDCPNVVMLLFTIAVFVVCIIGSIVFQLGRPRTSTKAEPTMVAVP